MTACTLHKSLKSKLRFVTLDKEDEHAVATRRVSRICSKEDLVERHRI